MTAYETHSIMGDRTVLLAVLDQYPALLACKFCHRPIKKIVANQLQPKLDLLGVRYECNSYFVKSQEKWVRKCHFLTWLTLPLKRMAKTILTLCFLLLGD